MNKLKHFLDDFAKEKEEERVEVLKDYLEEFMDEYDQFPTETFGKLVASGKLKSGKEFQIHLTLTTNEMEFLDEPRACRICGCTEEDCRQCIEKTGEPCHWVAEDLCSACVETTIKKSKRKNGKRK